MASGRCVMDSIASADAAPFIYSQSFIGQVDSQSDPMFSGGNSGYALNFGGNWGNNANAGVSYLNNTDGGANNNNGSRLDSALHNDFTVIPTAPECEIFGNNSIWLVPRAGRLGGSARSGYKAEVSQ